MHRTLVRFQSLARQTIRATSKRNNCQSLFHGVKTINKNSNKCINSAFKSPNEYGSTNIYTNVNYPLFATLVRYYSTDNGDAFGQLMEQSKASQTQGDLKKAYDLASNAFDLGTTPNELLESLQAKSFLAMDLRREDWQDEFLAGLKRFDPTSNHFNLAFGFVANRLVLAPDSNIDNMRGFFNAVFKVFPNNYDILIYYGEVLRINKQENEAVLYFKKAAEIDANRCQAWALLWVITMEDEYRKRAFACPDAETSHFLLVTYGGYVIEAENKVVEGIELIRKGLNANLTYRGAYDNFLMNMATLFMQRKDMSSAKQLLQIWLDKSPQNVSALNNLGFIFIQENNHEEAKKCYEKVVQYNPHYATGWFNLALLLPAADGVPKLLKAIELDPKLMRAHFKLAYNYFELNQLDLALKSINKAIELKNDDPILYQLKAQVCAKMKRYRDEFLAAYRYYELTSSHPVLAYHLFFADLRYEEGLAFVREHIQKEPNNSAFRLQEALYLEAMERYDEALKAVDVAIQTAQKNGDQGEFIMSMKAKGILFARTGNIIEAKQIAELLQQQYGFGGYIEALIDRHEGKFDEAIARMERTLGSYPFNVLRFVDLLDIGETLEAKGDLTAAAEQYKLVLEINPAVKRAQKRLQAVQLKLAK